MGTYTGQFGKGLITVVVNYINGQTISGYDIHKGLRRNFNGEVSQQGGALRLSLAEPGSNPLDGVFTMDLDTISWKMKGKWAPFDSSKGSVRQMALSRKVTSDSVFDLRRGYWDAGTSSRDSVLMFQADGTCSFEFYERPQDSTSQMITIKGNYVSNGKECRIEWEKNDHFHSMKLQIWVEKDSIPELRGKGISFVLNEE